MGGKEIGEKMKLRLVQLNELPGVGWERVIEDEKEGYIVELTDAPPCPWCGFSDVIAEEWVGGRGNRIVACPNHGWSIQQVSENTTDSWHTI